MADVPAWLLVVQTLVSGGVGLAGSFLIPRGDRVKLAHERRSAADAIMRTKAEEIFQEIERGREINNEAGARRWEIMAGRLQDTTSHDLTVFRSLDRVVGLVATYFPEGLTILREHSVQFKTDTLPINDQLVSLPDGEFAGEIGMRLRTQFVTAATAVNMQTLSRLEAFMVDAVAPHSPVASSQGR